MGDEAGDAGVYDGVEALAGLDAVDFVESVLGDAGDVEIFLGAGGGSGGGQQGGAALNGPCKQNLGGSFADACGDGGDDGIFEEAGLHAVTERGEGEEHDVVLVAVVEEFGFGQVGMRFDLDDGRLDARCVANRVESFQRDVGEADGAAFAVVDERFEGFPGVEQSGVAVVDDVAVFVARVVVVAGLKCVGRVNEVEVEIGEAEAGEAGFEGGFDAVGAMIGVPELCGDEDFFTRKTGCGEAFAEGLADFALIAVAFGAVEVTEASAEGIAGGGDRFGVVGDEGAEAEGGELAGTVGEGEFDEADVAGIGHRLLHYAISNSRRKGELMLWMR